MNLMNLPGPEFLAVWLLGAAAIAIATLVLRVLLAKPRDGDVVEAAKSLDASDVAYLESDRERAIEAAVAGLVHRGVLKLTGSRVELVADKVVRERGAYRGVVDNVALTEAEDYIVEMARDGSASVSSLVTNAGEIESRIRARLEMQGLLVERSGKTWQARLLPVLWLVMGGAKLMVGIARDKPVLFLGLLMFAGAWITSKIKLPRVTGFGKKVLDYLRGNSYGLEATASTAPAQVSGTDMAMAYALFGGVALGGAFALVMPSVQRHTLLASTGGATGSSGSCGSVDGDCGSSSDGGGSSCSGGSGCGGGGCGGCGGGCS